MGKNKNKNKKGDTPGGKAQEKIEQTLKDKVNEEAKKEDESIKSAASKDAESKPEETKKVEESKPKDKSQVTTDDIADDFANFAAAMDFGDSDDDKPAPKKVETKKADEKKSLVESEFEKVDVSPVKKASETPVKEDIVTPVKPAQKIVDNHIQQSSDKKRADLTGIQAFTQGEATGEIDSPMRKKKRDLGQLNTKIDVKKTEIKKFDKLEKVFDKVMTNFDNNKKEFEKFKAMSKSELLSLRNDKKLAKIVEEWERSLEMHLAGSDSENTENEDDLVEFNQLKNKELKEIEDFLQIFKDWVHKTLEELESEPYPQKKARTKPKLSKQSSVMLENAHSQAQTRLQAQLAAEQLANIQRKKQSETLKKFEDEENAKLMTELDTLAEDEELLRGLDELGKKEKEDIQIKKRQSSSLPSVPEPPAPSAPAKASAPTTNQNRDDGKEQGQGSEIQEIAKEEEDPNKGGNSNYGLITVVAALAIAGGVIAFRTFSKK